jgi:hypothetical protein
MSGEGGGLVGSIPPGFASKVRERRREGEGARRAPVNAPVIEQLAKRASLLCAERVLDAITPGDFDAQERANKVANIYGNAAFSLINKASENNTIKPASPAFHRQLSAWLNDPKRAQEFAAELCLKRSAYEAKKGPALRSFVQREETMDEEGNVVTKVTGSHPVREADAAAVKYFKDEVIPALIEEVKKHQQRTKNAGAER